MRRAILATVLAALLALAGCQAPGMGSPAGDELGRENGYWYDDELSVTASDGLNDSELNATVSRAMARVEHVRQLEFEESVPVQVINRSAYRNRSGGNHSEALRRFDNAKFEAMFLVGEENGSIEQQEQNRGSTVAGYYSPSEDAIVVVSESEMPTLTNERTLAHELVHALQDQHFGLNNGTAATRDGYQGRSGLVEGDASYTEERYMSRCGDEWSCLNASAGGGPSAGGTDGGGEGTANATADIHLGLYVLQYFPYSQGPAFVESLHERGGWSAVNDAYDDVPDGATEVIDADRYPEWEPVNVSTNAAGGEWEQITPPNRPDYGRFGQSAVTASLAYTLYDQYNPEGVINPLTFLNYREGSLDTSQPFNYSIAGADGWAGGRFVAFHDGADGSAGTEESENELAYVWRTKWDTPAEAQEFSEAWGALVEHWGGQQTAEGVYVIDSGPYADAVRITVADSTVTVVNAPERSDLGAFDDV